MMKNLNSLKNINQRPKIAILGLGIENYALVKFLIPQTPFVKGVEFDITICDARSKEKLSEKYKKLAKYKNIKWQLGKNYDKNLDMFDIIFRSPGYPLTPLTPLLKGGNRKSPLRKGGGGGLSSPMKLFFDLCPTKNIIGVTGTKGKGTTSTLIYNILKTAGKRVWLGGNIGVAPFEFLNKIKKNDWVVLELSSFQLEDMEKSPRIAVITNFSSEHLAPADPNNPNYHKSLKSYWNAKMNIVKNQKREDWTILNYELRITNYELNTKAKVIYFRKSELPSKLIGEHNKENIAAAVEVAKIVGIKDSIIKKAIAGFKGLEHRLEFAGIRRAATNGAHANVKTEGVKYYNDTFATTPESAITALKSFSEPIILIAGGAEKNSDFKEFAREVKKKVKFIILLNGDATLRIKRELLKIKYFENKIKIVYSMEEAVKIAKHNSAAGDIVLLSPACASFGMFKNYKERGNTFKLKVRSKK